MTGATCKLVNSKGVWFVSSTPGSVTVHSAFGPLDVTCKKAGQKPGLATVDSATNGMMFGNLLFGGLIGAAIDAGTGAGYDYPALIQVEMGKSTVTKPVRKSAPKTQKSAFQDTPVP